MTRPLPESTYREVLNAMREAADALPDEGLITAGNAMKQNEAGRIVRAALATLQGLSPAQATLTDERIDEIVEALFPNDNPFYRQWQVEIARPIARAIEAEFAKTAPGRLPQRVQDAIEVALHQAHQKEAHDGN